MDAAIDYEKVKWYATGYVTTGTVSQVEEKNIVRYFVGKVRGRIVGTKLENGETIWRFTSEDEARRHAWAWRECQRKRLAKRSTQDAS